MRLIDAARGLVGRFHGGRPAVALRMPRPDGGGAKSDNTLKLELSGSASHKLGLEDAELITQLALEQHVQDPLAILNAFAGNVGAVVIPLPVNDEASTMTVAGIAQVVKEFSDVVSSMAKAGEVPTENGLKRCDREFAELVGAWQALRAHLGHLHESGKPGAVSQLRSAA